VYKLAISGLARGDREPAPHRCSYVWETSPIPIGKYWPMSFGGGNVKKQQGKRGKCERETEEREKIKRKLKLKLPAKKCNMVREK
jgi:hypothetical protein